MQDMGKDSIAILPTASEQVRNRDVNYPFRPDSDFLYLTGFWEPEAVLVLIPGRKHGEYVLFCREKDEEDRDSVFHDCCAIGRRNRCLLLVAQVVRSQAFALAHM